METHTPHWRRLVLPLTFALICVLLSLYTFHGFGGDLPLQAKRYRVVLPLPNALNLVEGADVRMSGVVIGEVAAVRRNGDGARAELEIDREFAPLRIGTRAAVRVKTLLGEGYVALAPGPRDAPTLADGDSLPARAVKPAQQLDEFLETFDNRTRDRMRALFKGMADGYRRRGEELNDTLGYTAPLAANLSGVLTAVDGQRANLERLLSTSAEVFQAAGRQPGTLQAAVRSGNQVLDTTARRDRALGATVRALPAFVSQLERTATTIEATSGDLNRAVSTLRPVAPRVDPALRAISDAAPEFTALFRRLPGTIAAGRRGLPALTSILESAPDTFRFLYPASRELIPLLDLAKEYSGASIIGALANGSAFANGKLVGPGGKIIGRAGGTLTVTNESIAGWLHKLPTNRSNPYPKPGAFKNLATQGYLNSYDCRHTGNRLLLPPIGTGEPPCKTQGPWTFRGKTAYYPRLTLDSP